MLHLDKFADPGSWALGMTTVGKIVRLGNLVSSADSLAADTLASGAVIAVPTDTIYGLACLVQHSAAVERLYSIKVRRSLGGPFMAIRGRVIDEVANQRQC